MNTVNTVLGPISPGELGITLIHEHLICGRPGQICDARDIPYDRDEIARTCMGALEEAKEHGLTTIVDATPIDLGRDAELIRRVSYESGINIVCATGYYMEAAGAAESSRPLGIAFGSAAQVYETLMQEITQGIGDTGVKAGIIKVATGQGRISPYEEMTLKAAARAQKETGVPIISHTEEGTMGPEQADLLISEGADPQRISIGHMDGNSDLEYHTSVLERGVYIAFDRLGLDVLFPDSLKTACIIGLLGIGFASRIMLSHDYVSCWPGQTPAETEATKAVLPNWSFTHVFRNIIPALKEAGVSDDKIHTMMVDNPRRLFAGE